MKLIINLDKIDDPDKKAWLLESLKLMEIDFQPNEEAQSIEEYNADLESGNEDIEQMRFMNAEDLKSEARKW